MVIDAIREGRTTSFNAWARFWAVDLHVHTPGSADADVAHFGTPDDIVSRAIDVGLDAIAVTDHNTASWCERMATAAEGTDLVVLPGMELSTTEGHLLAIWDVGTPADQLEYLLSRLGIEPGDRGKLDIAADVGLRHAAVEVAKAGGLAIAAHVDREKGLLGISVAAEVQKALLDPALSAVEIYHLDSASKIRGKTGAARHLACVQGSDAYDSSVSQHSAVGIGKRRTWIKAGRPDLTGLRHAFADPKLRVRIGDEPSAASSPRIDKIEIIGGFLGGQALDLSPDLNTLLGGTGAGKSLVLEAIRYALCQQVDRAAFPAIHDEVASRLHSALGAGSVRLRATVDGTCYVIERAYARDGSAPPSVFRLVGEDLAAVDVLPQDLIALAAFSQGEVLEYSRQPVGRMALVDASIDLTAVEKRIAEVSKELRQNGEDLVDARHRVGELAEAASAAPDLKKQVEDLAVFFDSAVVQQQAAWTKEKGALSKTVQALDRLVPPPLEVPTVQLKHANEANAELFARASAVVGQLTKDVRSYESALTKAITDAKKGLTTIQDEWKSKRAVYDDALDVELAKIDSDKSLTALRTHLSSLQAKLEVAEGAAVALANEAEPQVAALLETREALLNELHTARSERRQARRKRVKDLKAKTAGFVSMDVPDKGDITEFRRELALLKVGSNVREGVLDKIAAQIHPYRFARALLANKPEELVDEDAGISAQNIARLLTNIADRDLWTELLRIQLTDLPDVLRIKFKKPEDGQYAPIEELSHGQRCTAVLVILLADGESPVLIDQPEDALHAPWIEEYLVDRLRDLRGTRQYILATRSPGIVVSGDAEQIITMRATASGGQVEACGSLERHDINRLALDHLEGGPVPFGRRAQKLAPSTSP